MAWPHPLDLARRRRANKWVGEYMHYVSATHLPRAMARIAKGFELLRQQCLCCGHEGLHSRAKHARLAAKAEGKAPSHEC